MHFFQSLESCEYCAHTFLRTHLQAIFGGQARNEHFADVAIGMCNIEEFRNNKILV